MGLGSAVLTAYAVTGEQHGEQWSPFAEANARLKFMIIAVTLDRFLEQATSEARG